MMTLLALPQPGPPLVMPASTALAFILSSEPRVQPRMAEPPTRSRSRRVLPRWLSQRLRPGCPGIRSIVWCRLAVEQKGGVIDQGPRQILSGGEAFVGDLDLALSGILPKLDQFRVKFDRFF